METARTVAFRSYTSIFPSYQQLEDYFNNTKNLTDYPDGVIIMARYNDKIGNYYNNDSTKVIGCVLVVVSEINNTKQATIYNIDTNLSRTMSIIGSLQVGIGKKKDKHLNDIYCTRKSISANADSSVKYLHNQHISVAPRSLFDNEGKLKIKTIEVRDDKTGELLCDPRSIGFTTKPHDSFGYIQFRLKPNTYYVTYVASNSGSTLVLRTREHNGELYNNLNSERIRFDFLKNHLVLNDNNDFGIGEMFIISQDEGRLSVTKRKKGVVINSRRHRQRMRSKEIKFNYKNFKFYIKKEYKGVKGVFMRMT